ncbi:MAG: peptidoglycan recognition family protein, partial [Clostridiales bacterium]|nr:peptidoglycan recognition family protein [Clostridiales bacterium]
IGNDGVVVRCVPENEVAYHASKANSHSIGVEVCHPDWSGKPTQKAHESLVSLLVELCKKYNLEPTRAIIRHYDVTGKTCPKYYVEDVGAFKKLKEEVKGKMKEDKELVEAVKVLQKKGVISSPEVWINGVYTRDNVRSLILKLSYTL